MNTFRKNKRNYSDQELIKMLFADDRSESKAIEYLLKKSTPFIFKEVRQNTESNEEINTILNEGLIILINNIRALKFRGESSIHSYYVGICRILVRKLRTKKATYWQRNNKLESVEEKGQLSELIENFERQDENAKRLKLIYGLITEKCREVLDLWARSYTMEEIRDRLGYKNTQIVMNKKNTCLKRISQQLKKLNEL